MPVLLKARQARVLDLPAIFVKCEDSLEMIFFPHLPLLLSHPRLCLSVAVKNNTVDTDSKEERNCDKNTEEDEVEG